jgi:fructose-bisphosphate aldolase class II
MRSFCDVLAQADQRAVAIGHFNISDVVALKAVAEAAREMRDPVAVGLSESERKFMGIRETAALVSAELRQLATNIFSCGSKQAAGSLS